MIGEPTLRSTNWHAVLVTMLIPMLVAGSLIYAALEADWDESPQWAYAVLALPPAEFARILIVSLLGDAFSKSDRRSAMNHFLLSVTILAAIIMLIAVLGCVMGVRDVINVVSAPRTWKFMLPVTTAMIADGVIALWFFSGDPSEQSARLEASAADAVDLLGLMLYPTSLLIAASYGVLIWLKEKDFAIAAWVPPVTVDSVRSLALGYSAAYFVAKACIFAYAQTAYFKRNGERLLGGSWLTWLRGHSRKQRAAHLREEKTATLRRRALLGLND